MSDVNAVALEAALKINDLCVQSHASVAQRTARIQIVVREALLEWERRLSYQEAKR